MQLRLILCLVRVLVLAFRKIFESCVAAALFVKEVPVELTERGCEFLNQYRFLSSVMLGFRGCLRFWIVKGEVGLEV